GSQFPEFHFLMDGSLVLRFGRDSDYIHRFEDGKAAVSPLPAWLQQRSGNQLFVVRGGKGYASWGNEGPCPGKLEVLAASSGTSCGCVAVPGLLRTSSIGRDGSLIAPPEGIANTTCTRSSCSSSSVAAPDCYRVARGLFAECCRHPVPRPRPPHELRFRVAVRPPRRGRGAVPQALLGLAADSLDTVQSRKPGQRSRIRRRRAMQGEKSEKRDAGEHRDPRKCHMGAISGLRTDCSGLLKRLLLYLVDANPAQRARASANASRHELP